MTRRIKTDSAHVVEFDEKNKLERVPHDHTETPVASDCRSEGTSTADHRRYPGRIADQDGTGVYPTPRILLVHLASVPRRPVVAFPVVRTATSKGQVSR